MKKKKQDKRDFIKDAAEELATNIYQEFLMDNKLIDDHDGEMSTFVSVCKDIEKYDLIRVVEKSASDIDVLEDLIMIYHFGFGVIEVSIHVLGVRTLSTQEIMQ